MSRLTALLLLATLTHCAGVQRARPVADPADFARLHLDEKTVAPWEDGRRGDGSPGAWEWWYFDAHLDDGSTLVVVFYDKPLTDAGGPMRPGVQVDLTRPDGTKLSRGALVPLDQFSSSKDTCDVRIGEHRFVGDLHEYQVTVKLDGLAVDVRLVGQVPAWRPGAGAIAFGDHDERTFSWLPAVPQGHVTGTVTTEAGTAAIKGVGYHDHNWGTAPLFELVHDWYWGRAQVGDYTVIASFITTNDAYGATQFPIFLLAKGDQLLAADARKVKFSHRPNGVDDLTRKPWSPGLTYDFDDGAHHYRVTFNHRRTLVRARMAESLRGVVKLAARLAELDPAYLRFTGPVTVEELDGDKVVQSTTNAAAVWELMYLGRARNQ
jgi:hypothetical protein